MSKQRISQSMVRPQLANTDYTIFDALLETLVKKEEKNAARQSLLKRLCSHMDLVASISVVVGLVTAVWVTDLVWFDISFWGKDLGLILFGSRVGEAISLGIGMQVIHYVMVAAVFLLSGLFILFRKRLMARKK